MLVASFRPVVYAALGDEAHEAAIYRWVRAYRTKYPEAEASLTSVWASLYQVRRGNHEPEKECESLVNSYELLVRATAYSAAEHR